METIVAGPRRPSGIKDVDGPTKLTDNDVEPKIPTPPAVDPEEKSGVLELSQEQTTALNLVLTRVRLAEVEHELALHQLKDIQARRLKAARDEAVVLAKISQRFGISRIKSISIAGPNSISYETE